MTGNGIYFSLLRKPARKMMVAQSIYSIGFDTDRCMLNAN
jgi:hypothetical protein